MILGFSTKIKGKETYFVEKILKSQLKKFEILENDYPFLTEDESKDYKSLCEFIYDAGKHLGYDNIDSFVEKVSSQTEKLHTIREDKKDRWKAGMMIDFFINVRKKDMFRFAPVLPVVRTQEIVFSDIDDQFYSISVDGSILTIGEIERLAINDGFDTVKEFLEYFPTEFKGKIIHWTDLIY